MNNYYVMPLQAEENDFIWCVMEEPTQQLISAFAFEDEALKHAKFLNRGGAFAGWTPSFILQEVVNFQDINQEFADYLSE